MTSLMCPQCGAAVRVSERKGMPGWGIGCIIGLIVIPVIVAVIGMLTAIAVPSFMRARETSQRHACMANLNMIESAKEMAWSDNQTLQPGHHVPEDMINPFLRGGIESCVCPAGGQYTIHPIGQEPECSVHGTFGTAREAVPVGRLQ